LLMWLCAIIAQSLYLLIFRIFALDARKS